MKFRLLLVFLLLSTQVLLAQKRYLVSPFGDVIPLKKNQSAKATAAIKAQARSQMNAACSNQGIFGFDPNTYPPGASQHIGFHKDIFASWFTAPASGTIDTVFWLMGDDVCAKDSLMFLRLLESNIYEGHGPGYGGYPPPNTSNCWGYYENTGDLDNGVAAFPEEATGPWVSTIPESLGVTSYPPFGNETWGLSGFPITVHAGEINYVDLGILGYKDTITIGEHFLITLRINGDHDEICGGNMGGTYTGLQYYDPIDTLEAHNWKFYEHVVNFTAGFSCKGWVARGGFHLMMWYSMTVTTNLPPKILAYDKLGSTLSSEPRVIDATIEDCDPSNPGEAGIANVFIDYTVNGVTQSSINIDNLGGNQYEGEIPGQACGTSVSYRLRSIDTKGLTTVTPYTTYKVVCSKTNLAVIDTSNTCITMDISSSGTTVDTSAFFNAPGNAAGNSGDDGTAGPFSLGGQFILGNKAYNYAWIGVNGAIALSETATDTVDVNSNGFYTGNWDFPQAIHHGRSDTLNELNMPPNFIAPFWNDLIIGDSLSTYGVVRHYSDSCNFVVQWDSVGTFTTEGIFVDETTFRVVLNKCENTVEFQYESVGTTGLDSTAFIGMQSDSTDGSGSSWILVNKNSYPLELRPRNDWCLKFYTAYSALVKDKWNLISLPVEPYNEDFAKTTLFPTATSNAFKYAGSYLQANNLENGVGYWLKFSGDQVVSYPGKPVKSVSIPLNPEWNLVGSLATSTNANQVATTPNGLISGSQFFGYNNGYSVSSTLEPGKAYWIKSSGSGTLNIPSVDLATAKNQVISLDELHKITITDATGNRQTLYLGSEQNLKVSASKFDMPPVPPTGAFDARFTSQRMVETYPAERSENKRYEYAVSIQSEAYPVTVEWKTSAGEKTTLLLSDGVDGKVLNNAIMNGTGNVQIKNPSINKIIIKVVNALDLPRQFSLGQNYPNPFNPVTHFKVGIPTASDVEISVYDILGRKVATLLNGFTDAGYYTVEWNGTDQSGFASPSGMYFVRLSGLNYSETKKIMLMK